MMEAANESTLLLVYNLLSAQHAQYWSGMYSVFSDKYSSIQHFKVYLKHFKY